MATYNCGNCREALGEEKVRKQEVGNNRYLVFCSYCNCYIKMVETAPAPEKQQ